jgi:hypothetical protein
MRLAAEATIGIYEVVSALGRAAWPILRDEH